MYQDIFSLINYNLTDDQFIILKELGSGTFGTTYEAYDVLHTRVVAIKKLDINKSLMKGVTLGDMAKEINIIKNLSQPHCFPYVACYFGAYTSNTNGIYTLNIISEFAEGNTLQDLIRIKGGLMSKEVLWNLYNELIYGLLYIHNKGYAHRDIKPANIVLTGDNHIKYIDFGLSCLQRCVADSPPHCIPDCKGTPGSWLYMPPEFFNKLLQKTTEEGFSHDIWSLSILMYEMANGYKIFPFPIYDLKLNVLPSATIKRNIGAGAIFPSNYTLDDGRTNAFLNKIVVNDPKIRPNIGEVYKFYYEIIHKPSFALPINNIP